MNQTRISFSNAYMFDRVMLDENICSMFLERVLGMQVKQIDYKNAEQVLEPRLDSKGVRLDMFVQTPEGVFDIEMEAEPRGSLGRRFRYYQSAIDSTLLNKGEDYWKLVDSFVIFVCKFDPFGRDFPIYNMNMACNECASVDIDCGMHWIVLNSAAFQKATSSQMRNLLEYVQEGRVNRNDRLISAIDDAVEAANADRKWVNKVFSVSTVEEDIRREARYRIEQAEKAAAKAAEKAAEEAAKKAAKEAAIAATAATEARFAALTNALISSNRIDDLSRAANDSEYLKELYKELGI